MTETSNAESQTKPPRRLTGTHKHMIAMAVVLVTGLLLEAGFAYHNSGRHKCSCTKNYQITSAYK